VSEKVTPIRGALADAQPARRRRGGTGLPEDCPVTALGSDPDQVYFLNAVGMFQVVPIKSFAGNQLIGLYAPQMTFLEKHWPRYSKDGDPMPGAFDVRKAVISHISAGRDEPHWRGEDCIRGLGVWPGDDDDLVVHLGNTLQVRGQRERPGRRDDFVYPVRHTRPAPATSRQSAGPDGPGEELLGLLRCWRWRRPDVDPILLAGWIAASFLCGALRWRPQAWLAGQRGTGKSTLMGLIASVLHRGEYARLVADATAPSIRAALVHDAAPVLHDEAEPSEDNSKLNAKIELMRLAASGGHIMRATVDQQVIMQQARFMALLASVIRPPLKAQDASRIVFLDLAKNPGGRAPDLREDALHDLGRRIFRRMVDGWPQFRDQLLTWRDALMARGMDARGADQYGTLLAAADLLLHDGAPDSDTLDLWCTPVATATQDERAEERPEWRWCMDHLTSAIAPQWRSGEQRSVGMLVAIAAGREVMTDETGKDIRPTRADQQDAARALATMGLRWIPSEDEKKRAIRKRLPGDGDIPTGDQLGHLAIANAHASLAHVFRGTHWQSRSGASGGWKAALGDAPGASAAPSIRFGGVTSRAVLVPIDLVLDGGEGEDAAG
jgi:hypothetical protein